MYIKVNGKPKKKLQSNFSRFTEMKREADTTDTEINLEYTFTNLLRLPKDILWKVFFLSDLSADKVKAISQANPRIVEVLNDETLWDVMFISKILNNAKLPKFELRSEMKLWVNKFTNERQFRQWNALKEEYPDHFTRFAAFAYYLEVYEEKKNIIFFKDGETKLLVKNTSRTELQGVDDLGGRERKKTYITIEEITFLLKDTDDETLRAILSTTVNETARSLFGGGKKKSKKRQDVFDFVQSKFTMLETIGKIYRIIQSGYVPRLASGESTDYMNKCICSQPAQFVCGGCMTAKYCSEACQKMDWGNHNC